MDTDKITENIDKGIEDGKKRAAAKSKLNDGLCLMLKEGEIINEGDESYDPEYKMWRRVDKGQYGIGLPYDSEIFREMRRKA